MKTPQHPRPVWWSRFAATVAAACLIGSAGARVLDDFDSNVKTDWSDSDPAHLPAAFVPARTVVNKQFEFNLPPLGQSYFVNSTKTSETFELKEGRTLEFRVDMVSGFGGSSYAVLAWIPTATGANSLAGYGIAKSETDVLVTKGINKYWLNDTPNPALKNNNVTLVLNLKAQGGNVIIRSQILDKDDNNKVIFDRSFIDTPAKDVMADGEDDPSAPFITTGNFVLYLYENNGTDQDHYQVIYDNAEVYVMDDALLDDFNDNTKTGWADSDPAHLPAALVPPRNETNQRFEFLLPPLGQSYFVNSTKTTKAFELKEGERHQFRVDLVSGFGNDSFAVLAWIPTATGANSLAGYGIAKSESDILITKGIGKYFLSINPTPSIKNNNVTLVLDLTVKNGNAIIHGQVLDKDDNNKVIFDRTFVDTPAKDVMGDGDDDPSAPFITTGQVVLYLYADEGTTQDHYEVIYDNLYVAAPPAGANSAPIISEVAPIAGANFLPANTAVSFKVTDDKALADGDISVTLNGKVYTTSSTPKLVLTGTTTARTVTLSGALTSGVNYAGTIKVVDSDGVATTQSMAFDTFPTSLFVIEVEDYTYESGQFLPEPQVDFYANLAGVEGIDFHDTRVGGQGNNSPYRHDDPVRMAPTLDLTRDKYIAGDIDYDTGDIVAGEWLNYTRDFAAGSYEVYLRVATVNFDQAESALELVTSDATQPNQTTRSLGSFLSRLSGFSYRNTPLTDATGNKVIVRLSGQTTLRLRQVTADTSSANRYLNYLAFVPVADPGIQRAFVASVAPAGGAIVNTVAPVVGAVIQNRDTSVKVNTIQMTVNGSVVPATVAANADGASLNWAMSPLPASGAVNTAKVTFKDNLNVDVSTEWTFVINYVSLDPANRQAGTGKTRGFKVRMVQSPEGTELANDLQRAEDQLALSPSLPTPLVDTNTVLQLVNMAQDDRSSGYFTGPDYPEDLVPGLDQNPGLTDGFTVEINAYLDLTAGAHRFGVVTDDGYKISAGASLSDKNPVLGAKSGGTANETFDFVAPVAGIYPFRMIWYEQGGNAYAEWFSVDLATGVRTLINDAKTATAVKAYLDLSAPSIKVQSSTTANGTFADDPGAQVDTNAKTATTPISGGQRFFRISGASRITSTVVNGTNLVMTYE